jgi:rod shape determining protein RodA
LDRRLYEFTPAGWAILGAVAMLLIIGIGSIYVTNTHYSAVDDGPMNAAKQCVFAAMGFGLVMLIARLGYARIGPWSFGLFAATVVLLVPLLVARLAHSDFGGMIPERNGAHRWIALPGLNLQPSEVMKIAYILAVAWYLRYRRNYRTWRGFVLPILLSALPMALILLQPDLGMTLVLVPVLFSMLFLAGAKLRHLLAVALLGMVAAPLAWTKIEPYQRLRITAVALQSSELRKAVVRDPESYRFLATPQQAIEWSAGSGYQLVHSVNAVGSGGVIGHGWGQGVYVEQGSLPDRHNDFIFAVIAHQWGLIGAMLLLGCYVVIVIAGARIAAATTDPFGRLVAGGLVALTATQVIVNVGMTIGILPITGLGLPFVSYGGSSLLMSFVGVGLLVSISQHRPFLLSNKPFEYTERRRVHMAELPAATGNPARA